MRACVCVCVCVCQSRCSFGALPTRRRIKTEKALPTFQLQKLQRLEWAAATVSTSWSSTTMAIG